MGIITYCGSCGKETTKLSFNCLECNSTYCSDCVGKAKDYGEGVREFHCPTCDNTLYFSVPLPAVLSRLKPPEGFSDLVQGTMKEKPIRGGLHPNKRASRPRSGVKQGAEGDD